MTEQPSGVRRVPVIARDGATAPPTAPPRPGPRRSIISTADYATAERIVDTLSDRGFPVERVAIIGHDMQLVEQVTGRMTYGRAAWRGALSGALPGALIGWIFGVFSWVDPLIAGLLLGLYGLVIGAALGAIVGLIIHAMQGGRRDFASVVLMQPQRYEVLVDADVADEAIRLLDKEI
ncbi:general stress protein [Pseudonocardia sp.]|uniref:general stress protein n=1 Tax=Pseudonocardia sp. TaxID=60912 RepID=UPI003D0DD6CA